MAQDERSGLQTALELAHKAGAAARIAKAAMLAGFKGAAVAAVKETLPFLLKPALGLLIAAVLIPMFVFTAMPNMFFGYETSVKDPQITMRQQALTIGGAYMSLDTFEQTQMDAIVTGELNRYQNQGVEIDHIDVTSDFDEEDLCWFIAINSVAHKQDLSEMTPEDIQSLCISSLRHTTQLRSNQDDTTTLHIDFKHFDQDALMDELHFDADARTWAGALYETLFESDAIHKYADQFEAYKPSYSGDVSYDGGYEQGGIGDSGVPGSGNTTQIDTSGFTDPSTKNNRDLAAYAVQAWENGWGYVWGTFGDVLTESVLTYKLEQYPEIKESETFIRENWLGRRTTDCVGLIKSYGWFDPVTGAIRYGTNGMPDFSADQMYASAADNDTDYGTMDTMPEIVGLALWKSGHIGVYIGGGYAIEAMGTRYGVVKTKVEGRGWQGWCKLPYIEYYE